MITYVQGKSRAQIATLLHSLLEEDTILFYELVMRCRDSDHDFFGGCGIRLQKMNFLDAQQEPHGDVRDVVLSDVTGDGLSMGIRRPG